MTRGLERKRKSNNPKVGFGEWGFGVRRVRKTASRALGIEGNADRKIRRLCIEIQRGGRGKFTTEERGPGEARELGVRGRELS